VSDIKRQAGAYKAAVQALAKGEVAKSFVLLDRLGWVKEADPKTLPERIADDYLSAVREGKTVLVVSPTHAQGEAITARLRERLRQEKRLHGEEREFKRLAPLHLTEAERAAGGYEAGTVLQFVKNAPGYRAGSRLTVGLTDAQSLSRYAGATAAFRPDTIRLAAGDLIRTTAGVQDCGGRRIENGTLLTVTGFTDAGNLRVRTASGIDRTLPADVGHIRHGYAVTSHASQGRTVDRVIIAMGADSFAAAGKEQFYVSVSRGRQKATIYTDSKAELAQAIHREDPRVLAHDLARRRSVAMREQARRHLAFIQNAALMRDTQRQPARAVARDWGHER
jgi:hypothetical protein